MDVPFVFLSNGEEARFLDHDTDAHARTIAGFWSQDDLERRIAARRIRRDLSGVAIDRRIVDRDYQIDRIEALSTEVSRGRRKLLVEVATGASKTRAVLIRHFERTRCSGLAYGLSGYSLKGKCALFRPNVCSAL